MKKLLYLKTGFTFVVSALVATSCSFKKSEDPKPTQVVVVDPAQTESKRDKIIQAIAGNNESALNTLLQDVTVEEINSEDMSGMTALETAIAAGKSKAVKALLAVHAKPLHRCSHPAYSTLLDFANSLDYPSITKDLQTEVNQETADFNSALNSTSKMTYEEVWTLCKSNYLTNAGLDSALFAKFAQKTEKLGEIEVADDTILSDMITTNNQSNTWNTDKVGSLLQIAFVANDMKYLNGISNSKQITISLDSYLGASELKNFQSFDSALKLLGDRNITASIDSMGPTFVSEIKRIISAGGSWDEFVWLMRQVGSSTSGVSVSGDDGIRDNYINYVLNHYYSSDQDYSSHFPEDELKMLLDAGKKLNGNLSISFENASMLMDPNGKYPSVRPDVLGFLKNDVTYLPYEFWKKVFRSNPISNIKSNIDEFGLSGLPVRQIDELIGTIDKSNLNPLLIENSTFNFIASLQIPNESISSNAAINELVRLQNERRTSAISDILFFKIIDTAKKYEYKYNENQLNDLYFSQINNLDSDGFCALNLISQSKPNFLSVIFNDKSYGYSVRNVLELVAGPEMQSRFEPCVSSDMSEVLIRSNEKELKKSSMISALLLKDLSLIDLELQNAIFSIFPRIKNLDSAFLRGKKVDPKLFGDEYTKAFDKSEYATNLSLLNTNEIIGTNYDSGPDGTFIPTLLKTIDSIPDDSLGSQQVIADFFAILSRGNVRFAIGCTKDFSLQYRKFLQSAGSKDDDPLYLLISSNKLDKSNAGIISALSQQKIELARVNLEAYQNFPEDVFSHQEISGKMTEDFPMLENNSIDAYTFKILFKLNSRLGDNRNWKQAISLLPPDISNIITDKNKINLEHLPNVINGQIGPNNFGSAKSAESKL